MPRDTVTVPREVLEECKHWHEREDKALSKSGRGDADYYYRRHQHQEEIARIDAALSSSDPEGGARDDAAVRWPQPGDQMTFLGENGYQAEREVAMKLLDVGASYKVERCDVGAWHHSIKFEGIDRWFNGVMFSRNVDPSVMPDCPGADTESDGGCGRTHGSSPSVMLPAASAVAGIKPGPSDAQLTKTPSADHDDGNLRGLSAPNHQPHAVSQGWRLVPIEPTVVQSNAGVDADDMRTGYETIKHIYRAMIAAAPPSPAKTVPAPSSVEER